MIDAAVTRPAKAGKVVLEQRVNRNPARAPALGRANFSELLPPTAVPIVRDGDHLDLKVDIVPAQARQFADAHPGGCEADDHVGEPL